MPPINLNDADCQKTIERLQTSAFRRRFRLSKALLAYAVRLGPETLNKHARELLSRRLQPAAKPDDGKQTPMKGHPVFVAQHALGMCCRGCLNKWYGIDPTRPLTEKELQTCITIICFWINDQLAQAEQAGFDVDAHKNEKNRGPHKKAVEVNVGKKNPPQQGELDFG